MQQAEIYNGSVVNIDSIQLYQDLLIGSAAPTLAEKKRAPHYLYSYVQAPKEMTAGDYLKDFYSLLKTEVKFPLFIVGGTGFYVRALEKGMFDIEPASVEFRKNIEAELLQNGPELLYRELQEKDPDAKIHINDHYRLIRAIEIIRHTGLRPSRLRAIPEANKNGLPFSYIKIGFDFEKSKYEEQVKLRTRNMISNGIIEETLKFYELNLKDWSPLRSVGYKETMEFLQSSKSKEWLFEAINQSTMQLIKKQKTWFKRDGSILWSNHEQQLKQFLS